VLKLYETATTVLVEATPGECDQLVEEFQFKPNGYWYAPSYERYVASKGKEGWDGFLRPVRRIGRTACKALRGRLSDILKWADDNDYQVNSEKLLPSPFRHLTLDDIEADIISGDFQLDDHQRRCILGWLNNNMGIAQVTVSGGKCLGKGTPVMLASGKIKPVEQVVAGDRLMGPNSRPRRVLATGSGLDELYRVRQANGDSYVCNGDHILAVQTFKRRGNFYGQNKRYERESATIPVTEWLKLSKSAKLECLGYKVGVKFSSKKIDLDPYFLGLWLGDGSRHNVAVTTGDTEIVRFLKDFADRNWLTAKEEKQESNCSIWHLTSSRKIASPGSNSVMNCLRKLGLYRAKEKWIPDVYKRNSRSVRMQVLAGLVDSDGSVKRLGQLEITSVYKRLADDICWLARSLGFSSSVYPKKTTCQTGVVGLAFRVRITGDLLDIPVLISRKRAGACLRGGLRTQLNIGPIGRGRYYGFELDGDGLFMLGDFTVTHNTAMFAGAAAYIKRHYANRAVLYITPSERLVRQTTREMKKMLPELDIGQFGGGHYQHGAKDVVVCTTAMLNKHFMALEDKQWFRRFIAVFYDEVHHAGSKTSQKVLEAVPAFFRFGASDTTKEDDERRWNDIRGLFGPVVNIVSAEPLMKVGRIAKPHIYIVDVKAWNNRFESVGYKPLPGSKAYVLTDDEWKIGTYLGPVHETDDDGEVLTKAIKTAQKDEHDQWVVEQQPIILTGLHRIEFNGEEYHIPSTWCLLDRAYDRCIIQFKERNEAVVKWAAHYSRMGLPTVVVCTRTLHVYILEALLQKAIKPELVDILIGKDTPKARDDCFDWFRDTPGAVLVTPLIKEGVSINEIRAGVIADYVADWEVANQMVGRFIRKKAGVNRASITWFRDRQHPVLRRGCNTVFQNLLQIAGYKFYDPAPPDPALLDAQGELGLE
jgi:superfamily II DNA or RNA helicase